MNGTDSRDYGGSGAGFAIHHPSRPVDMGPKGYFSNTLTYEDNLSELKANITYFLFEDRLVKVDYDFKNSYANGKAYLEDFDKVRCLEIREFGPPELEESEWFNSMFEPYPEHHGTAISLGHMKRITHWETPATKVKLILDGGNFEVRMTMVYKSNITSKASGEKNADIRR